MTAVNINVQDGAVTASLSGEAYRQAARSWLAANLPASFRSDSTAFAPPSLAQSIAWEAALHRAGLAGITWPTAYSGHGRTLREHLIANQEIGALPMPESVNSIGKELAGPIILAIGTEAQKLRFLPRILDMSNIWCQGFSEPEAGSDLAGLRTRAVRDGDVWRINGQKIWTSGAYRAQRCLLLARTGPVEDRHRGLALFAVPLDAAGVRVRTIKSIDGKESFCEVFFDDVEVAQDDALGAPDEGWAAAIRVLAIERATNRMYRAWRFENELRHLIAACKSDPVLTGLLQERHYAVEARRDRRRYRRAEGACRDGGGCAGRGRTDRRARQPGKAALERGASAFCRAGDGIAVEGIAAASARGEGRAAALRRRFICNRGPRRSTPAPPKFSSASSPIGSSNCREASDGDDGRRIVACRVRSHRVACGRGLYRLERGGAGARTSPAMACSAWSPRKMSAALICRCRSRCRLLRPQARACSAFRLRKTLLLARAAAAAVAADRDGDRCRHEQRDDRLERRRDGQQAGRSGCPQWMRQPRSARGRHRPAAGARRR